MKTKISIPGIIGGTIFFGVIIFLVTQVPQYSSPIALIAFVVAIVCVGIIAWTMTSMRADARKNSNNNNQKK